MSTLYSPEQYAHLLERSRFVRLDPKELSLIQTPSFHRGGIPETVASFKEALARGDLLPPIVLSAQSPKQLSIIDGLQRLLAAKELNFPLTAVIYPFMGTKQEQLHFIQYQNGKKLNANYLLQLNDHVDLNKELVRIQSLEGHTLKGRIWLGKAEGAETSRKPVSAIAATTLLTLFKKLDFVPDDIEPFLYCLGAISLDLPARHPLLKVGGLRGFAKFYLDHRLSLDVRNPKHVKHLLKFRWTSIKDLATETNEAAIEGIAQKLTGHWQALK